MFSPIKINRKTGWLLIFLGVIFILGCLNNEQKPDTFDLPAKFVDSLSGYDKVLILLKDTTGKTLDTLFRGKIQTGSQLQNLNAPHYPGGKMLIAIIGYKNGLVAYNTDRTFNGESGETETIKVMVLPITKVKIGKSEIQIMVNSFTALPSVSIDPDNISDKSLIWMSSNEAVFRVEQDKLIAVKTGSASLTVVLKSDTSKHDAIKVDVIANPEVADSLRISPDSLTVPARGRGKQFTAKIFPTTASSLLLWQCKDSLIATISELGMVMGIKAGRTVIAATTRVGDPVSDSAWVIVSDPIPVTSVKLIGRDLNLFAGGTAESLSVQVVPPEANDGVQFKLRNEAIAKISGGKVLGLKEGETWLVVNSLDFPANSDSIKITVLSSQPVTSVDIPTDSIRLYVGGIGKALTSIVSPPQATAWVRWASNNSGIASVDTAGKVLSVAPGRTRVTCISRVDSTRKDSALVIVIKDTPKLSVGQDTTVPVGTTVVFNPTAPQDYGSIAFFEWDLNGDGQWDSSSTTLKSVSFKYQNAKEILTKFHVRDSEGNDTTVVKKVNAISGPDIRILSPLDGAYFSKSLIDVSWSVDGTIQSKFQKETLTNNGANTVSRSALDATGKEYSISITVYLDTIAPTKPVVKGLSLVNSLRPNWSWSSGGNGGIGIYRYRLDIEDLSGSPETKDTIYSPGTELTAQTHTLYVQERDLAGNWSSSGSWSIRIDTIPPSPPVFDSLPLSPLNSLQPTWTWKSGGNGGIGVYRVKLDNANLDSGGTTVMITQFIAPLLLSAAAHTLYIQEKDSAGNLSKVSSKQLVLAPQAIIGKAGFSTGGISNPSLALSNTDVPYLAFQDAPLSGSKAIVMRFNGSAWENVGTGAISPAGAGDVCMVISATGIPYVAYSDAAQGEKASVMRFIGGKWEFLGTEGFTAGGAYFISLALGPSDLPYIAYRDNANGNRLGVKKFDGTNWVDVGGPGSTAGITTPSLSITSAGVPYVAFQDGAAGNKASLIRLSGNFWQNVGGAGFSSGAASFTSLALNKADVPYVAYQDAGNGYKAVVMRFIGTGWEYVGTSGFSQAMVNYTCLKFDNSGMPYLAYQDQGYGYKATVMRFNGTAWESVGNPGFTSDGAAFGSLALSSLGVPYIGFRDASVQDKATVMRTSFGP